MNRPSWIRTRWPALACALLAFAAYERTLAPGISWGNYSPDAFALVTWTPLIVSSEDSAELAGVAATLGIAHPSGYPLHTLLGHVATRLPLGDDPAFRTNLFSALCGSVAVAALWCALHAVSGRRLAASVASLLFAFSYGVWSHAIVTEVHALHAALLALCLVAALQAVRTDQTRWLHATALVLGLSLANHLTTVLWLPGLAILLHRPLWKALRSPGTLARLVASIAPGLALYLYLPLRASQQPLYEWGDATTLAGLWTLVSGGEYQELLRPDAARLLGALAEAPTQAVLEFGPLITALGVAGWLAWIARRAGGRRTAGEPRGSDDRGQDGWPVLLALAAMGLTQIAFVSGYQIRDSAALQIPVNMVFAFGIAMAVSGAERWVDDPARGSGARWLRGGLTMALVLLVAHPLLQERLGIRAYLARLEVRAGLQGVLLPHPRIGMQQHYLAQRFARGVLDALPPDAVFFVLGDGHLFAVQYEHLIHGRRPDVRVVASGLLMRGWYRERLARELDLPDLRVLPAGSGLRLLASIAEQEGRPVWFNLEPGAGLARRAEQVPVPLPPVGPDDPVRGDNASLYRLAPRAGPNPFP